MKYIRISVLLIAGLLVTTPSKIFAGIAYTLGYGNQNCTAFLDAEKKGKNDKDFHLFVTWIQGYLTAYSLMDDIIEPNKVNVMANLDTSSVVDWLISFCDVNPELDYSKAAEMLLLKLEKGE